MNIQSKIKRQGFTIAQVAAKMKKKSGGVGISQGTLSTILNGNPTIDKLREVADIIGISLSELVADDDTCSQRINCPYCGKSIRITLSVERDESQQVHVLKRKSVGLRLNPDDGTKYCYKNPRTHEERGAIFELQLYTEDDGMANVRNVMSGEVLDVEFDRLKPL